MVRPNWGATAFRPFSSVASLRDPDTDGATGRGFGKGRFGRFPRWRRRRIARLDRPRRPPLAAPERAGAPGCRRPPDTRPITIRHPRAVILIGAAAAVAAVAWAIVLLSPASDHPATSPISDTRDAPVTTLAVNEAVPASASAAGHSMVQLQADTSHGVVTLVGVAVAEGGLVATTANGLAGLRTST